MNAIYPILIFFGLVPSFIWLLFFLKKDKLPESKRMILRTFFYGMLATIPTALIELGFFEALNVFHIPSLFFSILYAFVGIGFTEEILKYLVVKKTVLGHHEFDEPVDAMIYMIVSALGFAALENLLILLPMYADFQFFDVALVSVFRFVGATFLHALASGLIGYYLAFSLCQAENKLKLMAKGIVIATLLHGLYDFSIMKIDGSSNFILPIIILIGLIIFVTIGFRKVRALKSVCKLK